MQFLALLSLGASALLASADPLPGPDGTFDVLEVRRGYTDLSNLTTRGLVARGKGEEDEDMVDAAIKGKSLWELTMFDHEKCQPDADITLTSKTPNSKCLKYEEQGQTISSLSFENPYGANDCKYGCPDCRVNVYYSPQGEPADCCDRHMVKRDWGMPEAGYCIDIRPPKNHRVRYLVVCG